MDWPLRPLRSWLYVPGNRPDRVAKALGLAADAVVIDLEDAVPKSEKSVALRAAVEAIEGRAGRTGPATFVRVNELSLSGTRAEIAELVRPGLAGLRFPKCEDPVAVAGACVAVAEAARSRGMSPDDVVVVCGIESARGVWDAVTIASVSPRIMALGFGAADFARDVSLEVGQAGTETLFARSSLVIASRVAGKRPPIESVWTDIADLNGLRESTRAARALGFFGRSVIHPSQIDIVNEVFTPDALEIARAHDVIETARRSAEQGLGAVRTGSGDFIDAAIVRRAEDTVRLAEELAGARS